MPELPPEPNRIVGALHEVYERDAEDWRRPHLGASVLGHDCSRYLWLTFRWAQAPRHPGRVLRIFERGRREEAWVADDMRRAGWDVSTEREDGEQHGVEFGGGHVAGSCDGIVTGVPGAPKSSHVWECKTAKRSRFLTLVKKGVVEAEPQHHVQLQVYMHGLKLKRALYHCVCKDDDHAHAERVRHDPKVAEAAIRKGELAVNSPAPLGRVSKDPSWHTCHKCHFRDTCQLGKVELLERNCRTCASSTPRPDGTWTCDRFKRELSVDDQKRGCEQHLFIPALLGWDLEAYVDDGPSVGRVARYKLDGGRTAVDDGRVVTVSNVSNEKP